MEDRKIRVLFVCIHNSARSQMAEAYLKKMGGEHFETESAGLEKGSLNPLAVEAMKEEGIDISGNRTDLVMDFLKQEKKFDFVVTVCDAANGERCPLFPGKSYRLHWGFEDPSSFEGSWEEKLESTRKVRDEIKEKVNEFVNKISDLNYEVPHQQMKDLFGTAFLKTPAV